MKYGQRMLQSKTEFVMLEASVSSFKGFLLSNELERSVI